MAFIWKIARGIFYALPGIVGFVVAATALAVFYMEELQQKLKDRRAIRWIAAIFLLLMGIGAFFSDRTQKNEDTSKLIDAVTKTAEKTATDVSAKVTDVLNNQYGAKLKELYGEIGVMESKIESQSGLSKEAIAINYLPAADLIYAGNQLQLWNRGHTSLSYWGNKLDDKTRVMERVPVVVGPTDSINILADDFNKRALSSLGSNGKAIVPVEFYFITANDKKYVKGCTLIEETKLGELTVLTQCTEFERKDWPDHQKDDWFRPQK